MEKLTFIRKPNGRLSAPATTKAAVAFAFSQSPGCLSREIVNAAASDLVEAAKDLAFRTGRDYEESSKHLMSRDPWLALAVMPIGDERADRQLGIEIIEEGRA